MLTIGVFEEKERVNVGVQENALGLGKVAEYVDSSAKTLVNYRRYRKEYELT